jgi:hypothetical protein
MFVDYMQGSKYAMNGKIKRVFKRLGFLIGLFWKYRTKAIKFLNLYNSINSGKFKDTLITKEQSDRFKRLFGNELYYTIENSVSKEKAEFSYIANASDREEMAKALGCLILHSASADDADVDMETIKRINGYTPNKLKKALIKQYIGEGTDESELTPNQRAFREVFESVEETYKLHPKIKKTAKTLSKFKNMVVTADGISYALAKEASLKIKETSYINVYSNILGEFMHGHLAVLNNKQAMIYVSVNEMNYTAIKNLNKIQTDYKPTLCVIGCSNEKINPKFNLDIPCESPIVKSFCLVVIIQLLALEIATALHRNVDKPRGLNKVVK